MKTYTVTVTDYATNETATFTLDAADADKAFEWASDRLDPTGEHLMGGRVHR